MDLTSVRVSDTPVFSVFSVVGVILMFLVFLDTPIFRVPAARRRSAARMHKVTKGRLFVASKIVDACSH